MNGAGLTVTIDVRTHHAQLQDLLARYEHDLKQGNNLFVPALDVIYRYKLEMVRALATTGKANLWSMANQHMANDPFSLGSWQAAANRFTEDARKIGAQVN